MSNTDRPTATYPTNPYPTNPFAGWRDRTPTGQVPPVAASRPEQPSPSQHGAEQDEPSIQDMWRPRRLPAWHPSLMQLAIGAALVAALLGACNVAAIQAHREARSYCHALAVSDWARAQRECLGTGASTPVPEQAGAPYAPQHPLPSTAPSSPGDRALTRVTPSPAPVSDWVTSDTRAPYDRTDASASPLDLPRCTTRSGTSPDPSDALPCLASLSADGSRAVVLEEDASLTGLVRR